MGEEVEASLVDEVAFGEVAQAPPMLARSAHVRSAAKRGVQKKGKVGAKMGVPAVGDADGGEAKKRQMELLRQQAVRAYKQMKKRRRVE